MLNHMLEGVGMRNSEHYSTRPVSKSPPRGLSRYRDVCLAGYSMSEKYVKIGLFTSRYENVHSILVSILRSLLRRRIGSRPSNRKFRMIDSGFSALFSHLFGRVFHSSSKFATPVFLSLTLVSPVHLGTLVEV